MRDNKIVRSYYIDKRQDQWLKEMAALNKRPASYFVCLALEKLIEMTGGYDGQEETL